MPWTWTPPPTDPTLEVLQELPEGIEAYGSDPPLACKEGDIPIVSEHRYYHCFSCEGWIKGTPYEEEENSMVDTMLAGREGTVYYCRRCGTEIGFSGCIS